MDTVSLLSLHDQWQRIAIEERATRREAAPEVVRHIRQDGGEGMVIYSRLTGENADRIIAEQIARYRELQQDFEWKTYGHDMPLDLKERLVAHGFEAEDPEALLILDLDTTPGALLRPVSHDVRRVLDPAELDQVDRINEEVWGERNPQFIASLKEDLAGDPDQVCCYLAYAEGLPVAHARITFHGRSPFAGLWGGSTLKAFRGRGIYTALLATRIQEARRRDIRFLTIDASPMSRPIVEKHGFQFLTMTQPFKFRNRPEGESS